MRRMLIAIAVAALAAGTVPARAAVVVVFAGPGSYLTTYTTPVAAATQGGELTLLNGDIQLHDVVSDAFGPDTQLWCDDLVTPTREFPLGQCPLFWTPLIPLTATSRVYGLENIVPGTVYSFYCSIHPGMIGRLAALPGAP